MQPPSLPEYLCLTVVLSIYVSCCANAELKIPSKIGGFWYNNQPLKSNSILIEAFLDPLCPDSRDSWPPLKQALFHYGSRVSLVVHPFPLPYHDNAFICSRALHIVDRLDTHPTGTYDLLEAFFKHQEVFYGQATSNVSRGSVVNKVAKFAAEVVVAPALNNSVIRQGFDDRRTDLATRYSFKYGCLKGVYGTPFFFVNGFPLPDAGSPVDYDGWKKIVDPLVAKQGSERETPIHASV